MKLTKPHYCLICARPTPHAATKVNHALHGILALLTCGSWGFVWLVLIMTASRAGWQCGSCGCWS